MELFFISIVSLCIIYETKGKLDSPPEVQTPLGRVQGQWKDSYGGRQYAAFEGVPYAKSPVGELRFEEPEPVEPWVGTWNATESYVCIQNPMDFSQVIGSEDCLYLDVFVPWTERKDLDVVVHIHGGAFMLGRGQEFVNPKYVMDRDIILVTPNYRLGPLGFLSTQDEIVPGNNGLKDQVLALKWVQENIASFGGNPNSVTLTGFSAGAASVHLHYFSPLSKGLFQRGMSTSGTALNGWVVTERVAENAEKLAQLVGCPISSTRELADCLKSRPAALLVKQSPFLYDFPPVPLTLFRPVVERSSRRPFINEHPLSTLRSKEVLDVPWITSVGRDEGQTLGLGFMNLFDVFNDKWTDIAPYVLHNEKLFQRSDISEKLREFYLGQDGKFSLENLNAYSKMVTDAMFTFDADLAAKLQSKAIKSPIYFYYFNYDQGENKLIDLRPLNLNLSGVQHGEDMVYLFGGGITRELSESDSKLRNRFLDMLSQYAKYGVPSFDGVHWLPTNGEELTYLNITTADDIKLQTTSDLSPLGKLWRQLKSSDVKDEL